jgi:hypothetical protein
MIELCPMRLKESAMKIHPLVAAVLLSSALIFVQPATAAPVSRLSVRVVTGSQELSAGSDLELRIYEAGRSPRRLPLAHGEAWLPASTHLIPVQLSESLDPRNVLRFALYYRATAPTGAPLEITSADVEVADGHAAPTKLLNTTLSGVIPRQGELATTESASLMCSTDADCDDHKVCNGRERCAPRSNGADARGCVKGAPMVCPVNQVCGEAVGCHGTDALKKFNGPADASNP